MIHFIYHFIVYYPLKSSNFQSKGGSADFHVFQNEYVQTLEAIGKVLTTFGEDNKIPAYGFGAKATSTGPLPYMFALDSEEAQLELEKIDVRFNILHCSMLFIFYLRFSLQVHIQGSKHVHHLA